MKEFKDYFSKSEIVLWSSSVMVIIISFCVFDRINYMSNRICRSRRTEERNSQNMLCSKRS